MMEVVVAVPDVEEAVPGAAAEAGKVPKLTKNTTKPIDIFFIISLFLDSNTHVCYSMVLCACPNKN